MRLGAYYRVSSIDEQRGQTTETQRHEVLRWAADHDHEVVGEYAERVSARDTRRRYEWERLMEDARSWSFQAVVVVKVDRAFRSIRHMVNVIDELNTLDVGFICTSQPFDTSTAAGRLHLGILTVVAEFEAEIGRERSIAGQERARALGKRIGQKPIDELTQKRIVSLAEAGYSKRKVAMMLGVARSTAQAYWPPQVMTR